MAEEFAWKWRHLPNLEIITSLLSVRNDVMIIGPPGSGKSTLVEDLLKVISFHPLRINCLLENTIPKMMAKIGEWLSKSLALNKASYNTIEALLKALTYSADPNMPGHLMNSDAAVSQIGLTASKAHCVIIFENFDLLIREEAVRPSETLINTLYYQLSHFIKVTNAYVSRIFVTSRNIDLPVLKFIIPYPDKPKLIDFVRFVLVSEVQKNIEYQKCLALLFNNVDQKIHDSLSSLANHIVQVYDILTKEFKTMEAIAKKTLQYVISIRKSTIGQGEATSVNFWMKSVEAIEKVLIRNTKLSYEPIKKIYDMIDSVRGPSDGEIAKIVRQQEAQFFNLPLLPAIILVSTYIANCTPQTRDFHITSNVRTNKKAKGGSGQSYFIETADELASQTYFRASPSERIINLAQMFLNIVFIDQRAVYEQETFNQTLQFASSFRMLEELRQIRRYTTPEDEITGMKFLALCERLKIEAMAAHLEITLNDYVQPSK